MYVDVCRQLWGYSDGTINGYVTHKENAITEDFSRCKCILDTGLIAGSLSYNHVSYVLGSCWQLTLVAQIF